MGGARLDPHAVGPATVTDVVGIVVVVVVEPHFELPVQLGAGVVARRLLNGRSRQLDRHALV